MPQQSERMSDEAVRAKTGKTWDEWLSILDAADARSMGHKEIVALLSGQQGIGPWWRQMITVTYEQARGMREKHQTATGYTANASRTISAPVDRLFEAWSDAALRSRWLPDAELTIRKATPGKSLRISWGDGSRGSRTPRLWHGPRGTGSRRWTACRRWWRDKAWTVDRSWGCAPRSTG